MNCNTAAAIYAANESPNAAFSSRPQPGNITGSGPPVAGLGEVADQQANKKASPGRHGDSRDQAVFCGAGGVCGDGHEADEERKPLAAL